MARLNGCDMGSCAALELECSVPPIFCLSPLVSVTTRRLHTRGVRNINFRDVAFPLTLLARSSHSDLCSLPGGQRGGGRMTAFTKETFNAMIKDLDKDGDGAVDKV